MRQTLFFNSEVSETFTEKIKDSINEKGIESEIAKNTFRD